MIEALADPSSSVETAAVSEACPWPGLVAFREVDQRFFKGRQRETELLQRMVRRERLAVLFGRSGLGKSSLLQAGLFPALRSEGVLPVYLRLDLSTERPDLIRQVKEAIDAAASEAKVEAPEARESDSLWEHFHRQDADFWSERNRLVLPLLVFDQFEELFTVGRSDRSRSESTEAFLAELADLVEGTPPAPLKARVDRHPEEADAFVFDRHHYKVLISLREDYLPDLEALRQRMSSVARNRFRLRHMNGEAARLVVLQAPDLVDAEVAERIVRFVAAADPDSRLPEIDVEPALLSVVCRELNEKRVLAGESKITLDLLEVSQDEILTDFYARSVADLSEEVREFIEEQLLTVSGYRDSVAEENALGTPGVTREVLDALVARRLLRVEDRGGVRRLELTHDLLTGVITQSRNERRHKKAEREEHQARLEAERRLRGTRRWVGALVVLFLAALGAAVWAIQANRKASATLERVVQTLREQLRSEDSAFVVSAAERLHEQHGKSIAQILDWIPDGRFSSQEGVAQLALDLGAAALEGENRSWVAAFRKGLGARLSRARANAGQRVEAPPTPEQDGRINERVKVPAGAFRMGGGGEAPRVEVPAFRLQRHEVTNGEYRRFDPDHASDGSPDHPVTEVTWYDAMAYAAWLGGDLPTSAQWEFAARGEEGRTQPWGRPDDDERPDCRHAVLQGCGGLQAVCTTPEGNTPGTGFCDFAGNVWEWCRDLAGESSDRVVRGGSWDGVGSELTASGQAAPDWRDREGGFRVAWPEPEDGS